MTDGLDSAADLVTEPARLTASNIGGIDRAAVELSPGVTVLAGYNATNRTSLLRAMNGALGGSKATLRSDASEGRVSLTVADEEYTRTYTRTGTGLTAGGEPFSDARELVDLFASLFGDNEVRRAAARGEDLYDLVMEPVDTAAIERRIRNLQREREELVSERDRVIERRDELPRIEQRRTEIDDRMDEIDEATAERRAEVAEFEEGVDAAEEANELVDELDAHRQELSRTEDEIELVESEREALEAELESLREDREALPEAPAENEGDLESRLDEARQSRRELEREISSLTTIIEFNRDVLSGDGPDLPAVDAETGDVTEALAPVAEQDVGCWTCGSRVERGTVADRLEELESMVEEKRREREEVDRRIDDIEERIDSVREHEQQRSSVERDIERTERKIEQRTRRLEDLESTAAELRETIQDLEVEAAETETIRENDLLEAYEELSELQYERGQLEQEQSELREEIAEIESLPDPADLAAEIDEVSQELEEQRSRVTDLEEAAVEEFNERMADVLDILAFGNVARVWIEWKADSGGSRGQESGTRFDLHVVREDENGTVYEDTVDHLSESEREVIGLVVALAGYLAHEIHRAVPFIALDSLEAIDAERIAELVSYFAEFATYLVVALLPEDADALPERYERVAPEEFNMAD